MRILLILITAIALVWGAGLVHFIGTMRGYETNLAVSYDAVIVLTGGQGRIDEAFAVFQQHNIGYLYISGVGEQTEIGELIPLEEIASEKLACCVIVDHQAQDTWQNARLASLWATEEAQITDIVLVTADYHMPRSLLAFARYMPEGITITPYAVTSRFSDSSDWWYDSSYLHLLMQEYHKYLYSWLMVKLTSFS